MVAPRAARNDIEIDETARIEIGLRVNSRRITTRATSYAFRCARYVASIRLDRAAYDRREGPGEGRRGAGLVP
jgi:hypothetical protein